MPNDFSYLIIVTRGHQEDQTVLRWAVQTKARYIGMIGSKVKKKALFQNLKQEGITQDQLNRVFINLIKNSEEAFLDRMQKEPNFKGNIDIEIDDNNDYISIRIKDNGTGITDSKKAMTPYFTTKKSGTGLGLPIVTKIINEHSGDFSIKNNNSKKGAKVTIMLPKYV